MGNTIRDGLSGIRNDCSNTMHPRGNREKHTELYTRSTYSCDYTAADITFNDTGCCSYTLIHHSKECGRITLGVPGIHNVYNSLAAIAVAVHLGIGPDVYTKSLLAFHGTDRRFQKKGELNGFTIIDDYAHHPTEITATLKAAAKYPHNTLWCVFQPHTYSRTKAFLKDFAKALSLADKVVLADIYASRETDTLGISSKDLLRELKNLGCDCYYFPSFDEIENFLLQNCINGDLLITMGAGDVLKIGENLLGE